MIIIIMTIYLRRGTGTVRESDITDLMKERDGKHLLSAA